MKIIKIKLQGNKGATLILVIFVMLMVTAVIGVVSTQVNNQIISNKNTNKQVELKYLAEAGVEKTIADIESSLRSYINHNYTLEPPHIDNSQGTINKTNLNKVYDELVEAIKYWPGKDSSNGTANTKLKNMRDTVKLNILPSDDINYINLKVNDLIKEINAFEVTYIKNQGNKHKNDSYIHLEKSIIYLEKYICDIGIRQIATPEEIQMDLEKITMDIKKGRDGYLIHAEDVITNDLIKTLDNQNGITEITNRMGNRKDNIDIIKNIIIQNKSDINPVIPNIVSNINVTITNIDNDIRYINEYKFYVKKNKEANFFQAKNYLITWLELSKLKLEVLKHKLGDHSSCLNKSVTDKIEFEGEKNEIPIALPNVDEINKDINEEEGILINEDDIKKAFYREGISIPITKVTYDQYKYTSGTIKKVLKKIELNDITINSKGITNIRGIEKTTDIPAKVRFNIEISNGGYNINYKILSWD